MKLRIVLPKSVKNCVGILMGIALNLWIAFARTCSTILNKYGESEQPCLVSDFSRIALSFSPFNLMVAVDLLFDLEDLSSGESGLLQFMTPGSRLEILPWFPSVVSCVWMCPESAHSNTHSIYDLLQDPHDTGQQQDVKEDSRTWDTGYGVSLQRTALEGTCDDDSKVLICLYEVLDFEKVVISPISFLILLIWMLSLCLLRKFHGVLRSFDLVDLSIGLNPPSAFCRASFVARLGLFMVSQISWTFCVMTFVDLVSSLTD
ncbi:hypothetical protein STEG23_020898 [Scotinomys teguina]